MGGEAPKEPQGLGGQSPPKHFFFAPILKIFFSIFKQKKFVEIFFAGNFFCQHIFCRSEKNL